MGNNEIMTTAEVTPQERAVLLNSRINANAMLMGNLIVSTGRDLKAMRDEKLYKELGFESFDEYCDSKTPFKKRNAYNFIQCFEDYGEQRLEELSTLGITKLTKLLALNSADREELIESGEAEKMTTRELKKRIKELQNKNEQLTLAYPLNVVGRGLHCQPALRLADRRDSFFLDHDKTSVIFPTMAVIAVLDFTRSSSGSAFSASKRYFG